METSADAGRFGSRLRRTHAAAALLLLNGVVAFLAVNALLWACFRARDAVVGPRLRAEEASAVEYEPYTGFRPRPMRGRFLNVAEEGFRHVRHQGPWPPDPAACNVFVFGGTTAFGSGLADAETIPSLLADQLAGRMPTVRVYNFARPGYLAVQERLLFATLLSARHVPRLAIFLDGSSEFGSGPVTAERMREALATSGHLDPAVLAARWLAGLPLGHLVETLWRPRGRLEEARPAASRSKAEWLANRRLIHGLTAEFRSQALFVWLSIPERRDDPEFSDSDPASAPDLLWLADLDPARQGGPDIAAVREDPALAQGITARIARHLSEERLLECSPTSS